MDPTMTTDEPKPKGGPRRGQRRRRADRNDFSGWLVLDKPAGRTSTDALSAVKRLLKPAKAGHAGTLDPLATGILPIAFGEATKTVPHVVDGRKVYRFTVRWGIATDTDDSEGEPIATSDRRPDREAIIAALPAFRGEIMQVPPRYSAVKVNGARAYDLARDGEAVALSARPIAIHRFDLVEMPDADHAVFEAECGKGGYVRALARDLGEALGCHGHVTALRRTRVGPFAEGDAITLDALGDMAGERPAEAVAEVVQPTEAALVDLPSVEVDKRGAVRLRRGQSLLLRGPEGTMQGATIYAMSGDHLVALGEVDGGELHPVRVFRAAPAAARPTGAAAADAGEPEDAGEAEAVGEAEVVFTGGARAWR